MKSFLATLVSAVLALVCLFAFVSCGDDCTHRDADDNGKCDMCDEEFMDGDDTPDTPDTPEEPEVCEHTDVDDDGKCDSCGEDFFDGIEVYYDITFWVNGDEYVVATRAGEIPVFKGDTSKPMSESTIYTFSGWNKELAPASEETTYVAQYSTAPRKYQVTYKIDSETIKTEQIDYGATLTPPTVHNGSNVIWVGSTKVSGETELVGYYTVLDSEMALWAMNVAPLSYSTKSFYENDGGMINSSSALLYLALGEYETPTEIVRNRVLEHLRSLIAPGHEPGFTAGPFWH